jgi:hypothetical protein
MGTYQDCVSHDIISIAQNLLRNGWYMRDGDGRLTSVQRLDWNTTWYHVRMHPDLNCYFWHNVLFNEVSMKLNPEHRFVPSHCQNCYKVVARPSTLEQLMGILEIQKAMNWPSKCGIETRNYVHGLYGAYWYNTGLEEGLETYGRVRKLVSQDIPVLLKRACTEFEMNCGPSDKWEITDKQKSLEELCYRYFAPDNIKRDQPDISHWHVVRKWIEFAYEHGDPTYATYTDGKPLFPPYVTYQHLAGDAK